MRPAFLGLPDGPVYSDEELRAAFDALPRNTSMERMEFEAYLRARREAREGAKVKKPRQFGGLR